MFLNFLVEKRLSDGRIIDFAVAVTAVADQVDDYVRAKLVAIFDCHARNPNYRINIFAIDVEDGNRLAPRYASGKARGVLFGDNWW